MALIAACLDVVRGIKIGFSGPEADDVDALGCHRLCLGRDRKGRGRFQVSWLGLKESTWSVPPLESGLELLKRISEIRLILSTPLISWGKRGVSIRLNPMGILIGQDLQVSPAASPV